MIKKTIIIVLTVAVLVTIGFIFGNSMDNTEATYKKSDTVVETVEPVVESVTNSETVLDNLSYFVRKAAHALEFMLLGAEAYALCVIASGKAFGMFTFAPLFGTLAVGVADELIQSFNERSSSVTDVLIDFSGAVCGMVSVLIVLTIIRIIAHIKKACRSKTCS